MDMPTPKPTANYQIIAAQLIRFDFIGFWWMMTKRKSQRIGKKERSKFTMKKGTLSTTSHLQLQLGQVSLFPLLHPPSSSSASAPSSRFQSLLDAESHRPNPPAVNDNNNASDDRDCILSQDFFCTPDYITPDNQNFNGLDFNMENTPCPKSPEKLNTTKSKRCRLDAISVNPLSPNFSGDHQQVVELGKDSVGEEVAAEKTVAADKPKAQNYVSHSAVALRCRVMPPPCIQNPYLKDVSQKETDPFGNQRIKCAGLFPGITGDDGLSRYRTDFHEIEQIGRGHFSSVFKVLKRIDGCLYAVKRSARQLRLETERRKALMEVQALAALGSHANIVGYYSSWFENEQLYIQMELCDHSLSINKCSSSFTEGQVLEALYQIANALRFIHEKGIAHLDVKPDNIYVKNGVYKLGDFGCATLLDNSLLVEEGDARYMPQEILNDNYDHLDKVDIFSLGASVYEFIRRLPLPESGCQFFNLKEGKLPLLPGHSLQFQNLLKAMMDPDPVKRPSARELIENPIFDKVIRTAKI
ncbi:wee1-like protein kinase isoform X1 [Arachis duranensis]|uniref:Wee1-like protein kinase n=2 Tax=Arachis duranensis TaxID=130453 RepID=A0A9C6WR54_ARADU|nr:wee1-like protein kinase isoform X1 [Arachis duranensis]